MPRQFARDDGARRSPSTWFARPMMSGHKAPPTTSFIVASDAAAVIRPHFPLCATAICSC
jgi:hypothetical protein